MDQKGVISLFGFWKKKSNPASGKSGRRKNRCSGCHHYNGFASDGSGAVFCALKRKATIDIGCSSFSPDDTASCDECYFRDTSRDDGFFCTKRAVLYGAEQKRCMDYAENWR